MYGLPPRSSRSMHIRARADPDMLRVGVHEVPEIAALRALLVCPVCRGSLIFTQSAAICQGCEASYAITQGVPVLVTSSHDTEHDELDHHGPEHQGNHSSRQAAWFDRPRSEEFEIT